VRRQKNLTQSRKDAKKEAGKRSADGGKMAAIRSRSDRTIAGRRNRPQPVRRWPDVEGRRIWVIGDCLLFLKRIFRRSRINRAAEVPGDRTCYPLLAVLPARLSSRVAFIGDRHSKHSAHVRLKLPASDDPLLCFVPEAWVHRMKR
jgi:hypothetical protein